MSGGASLEVLVRPLMRQKREGYVVWLGAEFCGYVIKAPEVMTAHAPGYAATEAESWREAVLIVLRRHFDRMRLHAGAYRALHGGRRGRRRAPAVRDRGRLVPDIRRLRRRYGPDESETVVTAKDLLAEAHARCRMIQREVRFLETLLQRPDLKGWERRVIKGRRDRIYDVRLGVLYDIVVLRKFAEEPESRQEAALGNPRPPLPFRPSDTIEWQRDAVARSRSPRPAARR